MARQIELNPVSHLTIGTVGTPGQRTFYIQGSRGDQIISLTIEKEQARMLADSFETFMEELKEKHPIANEETGDVQRDMRLQEPIEPLFRVGNMGLGYNEEADQVVIVAYELVEEEEEPSVVSYWASREQVHLLVRHAREVVSSGRFHDPSGLEPKKNGHVK